MSLKQKVEDLVLLVKESRKAKLILACAVGAVIFLVVSESPQRPQQARQQLTEIRQDGTSMSRRDDVIRDMTTAIMSQLEQNTAETRALGVELQELRSDHESAEVRTAEILSKMLERLVAVETTGGAGQRTGPQPMDYDSSFLEPEVDSLEPFGSVHESQVAPPPLPEQIQRVAYIGSADSVRVKLLAGVNAPTDGTPYPVVFKLIGDVTGPDGSALPIGEARLIAAAQGSLTDSRALFRLTNMSIRYPNGERRDLDVQGWIVGEDGIRGMQGVLIDPLGKAIGASVLTGTVSGLGQGISQSQSTTTSQFGQSTTIVDGDVAAYAFGRGLTSGASEWSSLIRERVRKMVPVVQVFSGREATAVFAKPVVIPGLYDQLAGDETDIFGSF